MGYWLEIERVIHQQLDTLTSKRHGAFLLRCLMSPVANKRSTIYLEENIHKTLRLKAAETHRSISDLVNEAVKRIFMEDQQDLTAFETREAEPTLSYEAMLKVLKADGTI